MQAIFVFLGIGDMPIHFHQLHNSTASRRDEHILNNRSVAVPVRKPHWQNTDEWSSQETPQDVMSQAECESVALSDRLPQRFPNC